nr:helix-hairpin-helix domain-containing protein [Desulfobulbaceae bacterium]
MFRKLFLTVLLVLSMAIAAFAGVNINTADQKELVSLSGIGPAKATAIIEYRKEHGSFKDPEELKKVKGIGQKTMEKLRDQVTVDDE